MSLGTNGRAILAATRELSRKWDETKVSWRDSKSEEFEKEYLADLFSNVDRALVILDELDRLLASVRSQCD
jgi:hypothetical protein